VSISDDLAPLTLPTRSAVPLALILNELLTNAVKHAFAPGRPGHVRVSLAEEGGLCRLRVADDGEGMAEGVPGAGRGLVEAFVAELDGELAYETGPQGTTATVTFKV
jgi:two-component sensor histidine kinase